MLITPFPTPLPPVSLLSSLFSFLPSSPVFIYPLLFQSYFSLSLFLCFLFTNFSYFLLPSISVFPLTSIPFFFAFTSLSSLHFSSTQFPLFPFFHFFLLDSLYCFSFLFSPVTFLLTPSIYFSSPCFHFSSYCFSFLFTFLTHSLQFLSCFLSSLHVFPFSFF